MYAIYLRKSRNDDPHDTIEQTLSRHESILYDLANRMQITINKDHVYKEVVSGESIAARPEMQRLLTDIEKGIYEGVLVVEVERLARGNSIDQGIISQAFQYSKTKIITPLKVIDPSNEYDQEYFEFGLFMSRREYKTINRRMQQGRKLSSEQGLYVGSCPPYGYQIKRLKKGTTLQFDAHEYPILTFMKDLIVYQNKTISEVADTLNHAQIKPRKSDYWTRNMVLHILTNPVNIGKIKWEYRQEIKTVFHGEMIKTRPRNKQAHYYKGLHPSAFTDEEYALIKSKIHAKKGKTNPHSSMMNPLSGLIICGFCGKTLLRRPYKDHSDFLICPTKKEYCPNVSSQLKIVEDKILWGLKKVLMTYDRLIDDSSSYAPSMQHTYTLLSQIDKDLCQLQKQFNKTYEFLEIGTYSLETFQHRQQSIQDKMHLLHQQKEKITLSIEQMNFKKEHYTIPILKKVIHLYDLLTPQDQNKLLSSLIDHCIYKKTKSSRWNPQAIDDFELEIYLKI